MSEGDERRHRDVAVSFGGDSASGGAAGAPQSGVDVTLDARDAAPSSRGMGPTSRRERALHRWNASRLPLVDPSSYRIAGEFAKGGIGRVLRAHDVRLDRSVALKELIEQGGDAEERFVREALITARLQHPSIVPIHEAGRWPTGEPFYSMKLVSGRSLAEVIGSARTQAQRLALLPPILAVADAIAYAHSKRIIHRDLKPANVLIGAFGEIVVIDWGLAKDLDEDSAEEPEPDGGDPRGSVLARAIAIAAAALKDSGLTMAGAILGTPAYMAPEQASGGDVDERADVYAIGAILYHTLTGSPPYGEGTSLDIIKKSLAGPAPNLDERLRGIPEDLVTIVKKAMAREREARYRTATELADDLRRFQTGQIVGAHTYSRRERLLRFVRKNSAALAVAAAALGVIAIGSVAGVRGVLAERDRAERERDRAEHERDRAERGQAEADHAQRQAIERADALTLLQARTQLDRDPNRALAWLKTLSPSFARWPVARMIAGGAASRGIARVLRGHTAAVDTIAFSPDGLTLATTSDDHTIRLWTLATGDARVLRGHTDEVWGVAFSPSGELLATSSKDKTIRVWNVQTGASRVLAGHGHSVLENIAFSPDGSLLASRDDSGEVRLWDVATGAGKVLSSAVEDDESLAFSPNGKAIAFTSGKSLFLWSIARGTGRRFPGQDRPAQVVAFAPDGARVATGDAAGKVRLWDTETGAVRSLPGHTDRVWSLRFSRDGQTLFSSAADRIARATRVRSGESRVFRGHEGGIYEIAVSPDEGLLATGSTDHTVRLWDAATGDGRALIGFEDGIFSVAFSPDGKMIAAGGWDHTVRLWSTAPRGPIIAEHEGGALPVAFLPDGRRAVSAGADGVVRVSSLAPGGEPVLLDRHAGVVLDVCVSPDGTRAAWATRDGAVRIGVIPSAASLAGRPGPALVLRGHTGEVLRVAFSPDGKLVASSGADRTVRLWDAATGESRGVFRLGAAANTIAFSPAGGLLATAGEDKIVRVWTLATGESRALPGHDGPVLSLAFSLDGRLLASGGADHTILLWTVDSGKKRSIDTGGLGVSQIAFLPDGKAFVSLCRDSSVRLWDTATGELRSALRGHSEAVAAVAVSPDGQRAVSASLDRSVRLWDLSSGEGRVLGEHAAAAVSVAFSPDGRSILSAGKDGDVRLWSDDLPTDSAGIRAWLDAATADRIDIQSTNSSP